MMLLAGSLLLGVTGGFTIPILEHHLVREFDEIKEEKKWPIGILPVINGILCMMAARHAVSYLEAVINIILISLLVLLACFDMKYMLLPTKAILPGILLCLLWQLVQWGMTKENSRLLLSLLGGLVGFGLFWLIFYGSRVILKRDGLGFGDVRLMALIGLIVGLDQIFLVIIIASLLAVVAGGILFAVKRRSEAFPFGPFLCLAALIMMLFENEILLFYLRCLGL